MNYHGKARVNPRNLQAFALCDRCFGVYNHPDLQWQFEWRGNSLQNTGYLVCRRCLDIPQEQFRALILPPDPVPIANPRPYPYLYAETGFRATADGSLRITEDDNYRVVDMDDGPPVPLEPIPRVISVIPGATGGYAGSTYLSDRTGQWSANGTDIPEQNGLSWPMTIGYEGDAIRCADSNAIRMWTFDDLGANTSEWDARHRLQLSGLNVTQWDASNGVYAAQTAPGQDPVYSSNGFNGFPCLVTTTSSRLSISGSPTFPQVIFDPNNVRVYAELNGSAILAPPNSWPANEVVLITIVSSSGSAKIRINGSTVATSGTSNATQSVLWLGVRTGGGVFSRLIGINQILGRSEQPDSGLIGQTAKIVRATDRWSDADVERAEGCAVWQYKVASILPAGHPYKLAPPTITV